MSGLMGPGGQSNADRKRAEGGWQAEWENLMEGRKTHGTFMPQAQAGFGAGTGTMGAGADYLKQILGSRTDAAGAMAPESNALAQQADALRQAQAQLGTARGGGVAGANQQAQQALQNQYANQLFAARQGAAPVAVQAGQAQASVAAQQMMGALQAMGMSNELATHIVNSSMKSREAEAAQHRQTMAGWMGLAGNLLGIAPAGSRAAQIGGAINKSSGG